MAVYRMENDAFHLVEMREAPGHGGGDERWKDLAKRFSDCRAVLVSGAGQKPVGILEATGLKVLQMEGLLEVGLETAFQGKEIPASLKPAISGCAMGCGGTGLGCS